MRFGSILITAFFGFSWGFAAPISFNTALPVHKEGVLFRQQLTWTEIQNDPSPLDREMDVIAYPAVFVYGATSKLALFGVVPLLDKELKIKSANITRETSGLGDISTMVRYQVYERNVQGQTWRGAVLAGVKWPTGKDNASDSLGRLPPSLQLGSGSFDPFIGTVWTTQWLSGQVDADVVYRRNTRANNVKIGDTALANISYQHRLWPKELESKGTPSYIYGVLEANNVYQEKTQIGNGVDNNSGGYQLFLTPGLQWVTKRVVWELATQLPAIQELNGNSLETDFRVIGSFRFWF